VVVIVVESLRFSATSLGDPVLGTTPFLADLSRRSTVARHAYTVVPHTSKALTAIHCGIAPPLDTKLTESEPGGIPTECLPKLLGRQGYATALFQSAVGGFERRPDLVRNLGFDEFRAAEDLPTQGFGRVNYFGYEDDILLEPSAEWIRAQQQPFMLSLLTVAGHHDYHLPETFPLRRIVEDDELNRYLNTLVYQDRFVSKVFAMLDELGIADETVVAVMGDHGEGFGEHGLRQHDNTIYEEGVKVPLMIYDPADPVGRVVDTPMTTMSTMPTVVEALGYRLKGGLSAARPLADADDRPVYLSCQADNRCLARIEGTMKYIYHFDNRPDEVFDLAIDPLERDNLIASVSRSQVRAMRAELLAWRAEVRAAYAAAGGRR
jgi:phosphoglycerol transferase MdoB-like AlkP superfamily enzyme